MLTCLTIVTGLSDYIDGQCSFWVRMQFRLHLGLCAMCRTYLRQFKLTIEAVRRLGSEEVPPDGLCRQPDKKGEEAR